MNSALFDDDMDKLLALVEEGARASESGVQRFIEPMQGTLRRAQSKRHHLIFGRRGSGKSSLLYKSTQALDEQGVPVAYLDLEPFKGQAYPEVVLSVVTATFKKYQQWLERFTPEGEDVAWYLRWMESSDNQWRQKAHLLKLFAEEITRLEQRLRQDEGNPLSTTEFEKNQNIPAQQNQLIRESEQRLADLMTGLTPEQKSTSDFLQRKLLDYQNLFNQLERLSGCESFLFLDDFYHINRQQQPYLLDYFHRIAKGCKLWIKVGTIKHRSNWYLHTPQPIGLKTGDDADDIDLDLTLERFSTLRHFLAHILDSYIEETGTAKRDQLLSATALDRMVVASGGVTRDFLGLFRRAVDQARERLRMNPDDSRGQRISTEDVGMAASDYGEIKREEFHKDTMEDQIRLDEAFQQVRKFCLETSKANVFLLNQEHPSEQTDLIQELVDLRLIHHVKSRVTVSSRPGQIFRALMLDVSQYAGERKRRDVDLLEFWKDERELLRKASLIYQPEPETWSRSSSSA